jgi:hypothetical protein
VPFSLKAMVARAAVDPLTYMRVSECRGDWPRGQKPSGATQRGGALGKVQAAEDAAKSSISSHLNTIGDNTLTGIKNIHPFFGNLLDLSPRARVAIENDKAVNLLGHVANFFGEDTGGRTLADLARTPTDPRFQDATQKVGDRLQSMLDAAGASHLGQPIDPNDVTATFQSLLPGFESGHAQELGQKLGPLFDRYDRDMQAVTQTVGNLFPQGAQPHNLDEAIKFAQAKGLDADAAVLEQIQKSWRGPISCGPTRMKRW